MIIGYSRDGGGSLLTDTWNPADKSATITLTNGNTTATSINNFGGVRTVGSHATGKWYFELLTGTFNGNIFDGDGIGIVIGATALTSINSGVNTLWLRNDGLIIVGSVSAGNSCNAIQNATIGFAINLDSKLAWVRNDFSGPGWFGAIAGAADPATSVNGIDVSGIFGVGVGVFPCMAGDNTATDVCTFNQTLTYAVPSGFLQW